MTNDRTSSLTFWLMSACAVLVGGFAGWCGKEFWTWQNMVIVVLPPVVVIFGMGVPRWRQLLMLPVVVLPVLGGVILAGMWLFLAASIAAFTDRWPSPAVRVVAGAGVAALGFGMTWAFYIRPRRATRHPEMHDSHSNTGPPDGSPA